MTVFPFQIIEKITDKPLRIRGVAIAAGMSRNFNIYTPEELEAFASRLVGAPVYIEHVSVESAIGKVTKTEWDGHALWYEAEIYESEIADVREKLIVSAFALGGFREECFTKLQYRHVKDDIEANRVPIHVHIEAEITKGKYHDYDTFLGAEAAQYLKLYIEQRRKGSGSFPPETITDDSPLIRDSKRAEIPRGVRGKTLRKVVHSLYAQAGLLRKKNGRMYDLRTHSLRKYFKTQLLALGVQPDYVDYMMGHTVNTYDDIQSLGIDTLRNIYAASGLAIRPKTRASKVEALKEIIRAWGMNPEQLLAKDALIQGAITNINPTEQENHQLKILANQLKELIKQEATA